MAELLKFCGELASDEVTIENRAKDLDAKQRDPLGVIGRT